MGRYLVVADVHSNAEALRSVLDSADRLEPFDAIWLLGDVVGSGPAPNECIEVLSAYPFAGVSGNHDLAVLGKVSLDRFNADAAEVCRWTRCRLTLSSKRFLSDLSIRCSVGDFLLVHGSPRDPVWEYVVAASQVRMLGPWCEQRHALIGHTHRPLIAYMSRAAECRHPAAPTASVQKLEGRLMINPGSVGQPRDGDARAAYAILDTSVGEVSFHRVSYNVVAVAQSMQQAGLPVSLQRRLHVGY